MVLDTATIESERLRLEPLQVAHATEMVSVLADSGLYEFTGGEAPELHQLEARYRFLIAGPRPTTETDEIWHNWILRKRDGAEVVGYVQATVVGSTSDVAWLIGQDFQGRGFAREAAAAMSEWLVANGVEILRAYIHPDHTASAAVAVSIGLRDSGEIDDEGERIWTSTE